MQVPLCLKLVFKVLLRESPSMNKSSNLIVHLACGSMLKNCCFQHQTTTRSWHFHPSENGGLLVCFVGLLHFIAFIWDQKSPIIKYHKITVQSRQQQMNNFCVLPGKIIFKSLEAGRLRSILYFYITFFKM